MGGFRTLPLLITLDRYKAQKPITTPKRIAMRIGVFKIDLRRTAGCQSAALVSVAFSFRIQANSDQFFVI